MKRYIPVNLPVNAFMITAVIIDKPKKVSNGKEPEETIVITGNDEEDMIAVDRMFLANNQPNIGDYLVINGVDVFVVKQTQFSTKYKEMVEC